MRKNGANATVWQEISTVIGVAFGTSFFTDLSFLQMIATLACVVVYAAAKVFFATLAGVSSQENVNMPKWFEYLLAMAVGAGIATGMASLDRIGIGPAIALVVFAALIPTVWRQRWREQCVYRGILSTPTPETTDSSGAPPEGSVYSA